MMSWFTAYVIPIDLVECGNGKNKYCTMKTLPYSSLLILCCITYYFSWQTGKFSQIICINIVIVVVAFRFFTTFYFTSYMKTSWKQKYLVFSGSVFNVTCHYCICNKHLFLSDSFVFSGFPCFIFILELFS